MGSCCSPRLARSSMVVRAACGHTAPHQAAALPHEQARRMFHVIEQPKRVFGVLLDHLQLYCLLRTITPCKCCMLILFWPTIPCHLMREAGSTRCKVEMTRDHTIGSVKHRGTEQLLASELGNVSVHKCRVWPTRHNLRNEQQVLYHELPARGPVAHE